MRSLLPVNLSFSCPGHAIVVSVATLCVCVRRQAEQHGAGRVLRDVAEAVEVVDFELRRKGQLAAAEKPAIRISPQPPQNRPTEFGNWLI
jgi:hypothetical protein